MSTSQTDCFSVPFEVAELAAPVAGHETAAIPSASNRPKEAANVLRPRGYVQGSLMGFAPLHSSVGRSARPRRGPARPT
jgi:hypothetical protein